MIQLIFGPKGSGKTKRMIEMANEEVAQSKGNIVFISEDKRYMYDIARQIRFVDLKEYHINTSEKLYGFICGMMAQDFDISTIYIDGLLRIVKQDVSESENLIKSISNIAEKNNVKAVITVGADVKEASTFLKQLII